MVQYLESLRWVKSFYLCKGFPCGILPHGFYMFGDFVWRGKRLLFLIISVFGKDFCISTYGEERMTSQEKCLFLCVLPPFLFLLQICLAG